MDELDDLLRELATSVAVVMMKEEQFKHTLLCVHLGAYEECDEAESCLPMRVVKDWYDRYMSQEDKEELDRTLYGFDERLN